MLHRRQFLQGATAIVTGAALTAATGPARGIQPIPRNGQPKFKFSLAAYSYRDLLQPKQGKEPLLTLKDFIDDCAKLDLEGTELTSYYFPKEVTADYLHGLRQHAFRLGWIFPARPSATNSATPRGRNAMPSLPRRRNGSSMQPRSTLQ